MASLVLKLNFVFPYISPNCVCLQHKERERGGGLREGEFMVLSCWKLCKCSLVTTEYKCTVFAQYHALSIFH